MPKSKPLKLVIDTNFWISFIISNRFAELDSLLFQRKARLLFSAALVDEISLTITKPKLKRFFTGTTLQQMLHAFDEYIDFVEVKSVVNVCRDANDDFLLALAKDGKADYLITGDNDLLSLRKFGKVEILSMAQFKLKCLTE